MTQEEREKLIEEMTKVNAYLGMAHALAIAEAAFAKEIEAAYIEGFSRANEMIIRRAQDHEAWSEWYSSRSFAAILASIPEKP